VRAQETSVLILTAGRSDYDDPAYGDGRQLKALLGHFSARVTLKGALEYVRGEADAHDVVFYIGFDVHDVMPASLANDLLKTRSRVVWMNTGIVDFCRRSDVAAHLSFTVSEYDSTSGFDKVRAAGTTFKKEDAHLARIRILDRNRVEVLATAVSSRSHREAPYAIRSGNFFYFADSPFAYAVPGGHYLFFADLLHDILGQPHETVHQAMIRIEDVTLFESPDKLRSVADFLSSRGVPFMVGVVPFFVDPAEGLRLSLTDKPELVDALQYMVRNGGTIVMHGVTHQYKGVTATDYEFWDEGTRRPIKGESEEAIARKLEMGIQEFLKNGLYPLVWETPHYTASSTLYRTVAKYFSTACEQRLALDHEDQSQFFPYVIHRDLYGQTVYPENLGYVPQDSDLRVSEAAVDEILDALRRNGRRP